MTLYLLAKKAFESLSPAVQRLNLLKVDSDKQAVFHVGQLVNTFKIDSDKETVLNRAVKNNQTEVVRYLCSLPSAGELVEARSRYGYSALHFARSREIAKTLVESVAPDQMWEFVTLRAGWNNATALNSAAEEGRIEVVEYLCSLYKGKLVSLQYDGETALHFAQTREVAEILVETVKPGCRMEFILLRKVSNGKTALLTAAAEDRAEVVKYICSLYEGDMVNDRDIAQSENEFSEVATNTSRTVERKFLFIQDNIGNTVLHYAVRSKNLDLVQYLCRVGGEELILLTNKKGYTGLHLSTVASIPRTLVDSVTAPSRKQFIFALDNNGRTAFHYAGDSRPSPSELVKYYCEVGGEELIFKQDHMNRLAVHLISVGTEYESILLDIFRDIMGSLTQDKQLDLLLAVDKHGQSPLHYFCEAIRPQPKFLRHLFSLDHLFSISTESRSVMSVLDYLNLADFDGNTALMLFSRSGRYTELKMALTHIQENYSDRVFQQTLTNTNNWKQNIFHLAWLRDDRSGGHILECLNFVDDIMAVMQPDDFGNIPLYYMATFFQTEVVAQVLSALPMDARHHLVNSITTKYSRDRAFPYNWPLVIGELVNMRRVTWNSKLKLIRIHQVEKGMTWEIQRTVKSFHVTGMRFSIFQPLRRFRVSQAINYSFDPFMVVKYLLNEYPLVSRSPGPPSALFYYFDYDNTPTSDHQFVQADINQLDVHQNHGIPKVVLLKTSDKETTPKLTLPGPDFIFISVQLHTSVKLSNSVKGCYQLRKQPDIPTYLSRILKDRNVKSIDVKSTLSKHYKRDDLQFTPKSLQEQKLVTGKDRGSALIICNRAGRDGSKTKRERRDAIKILNNSFGLEIVEDEKAHSIIEAVGAFAKKPGHGPLAGVAIMSHGVGGDIVDFAGKTFLTVQSVVDALNSPELKHTTKLLFLSFCRGELGGRNRTSGSWENKEARLLGLPNPLQGLSPEDKKAEWDKHPFPAVNLPESFYICYSTLPDSESKRGLMFGVFVRHLSEICRSSSICSQPAICPAPPVPDSEPPPDVRRKQAGGLSSTSSILQSKRVELVWLLTDVAGLMRNTDMCRQYMNIHYKLTKESKSVVIDVLDPYSDHEH